MKNQKADFRVLTTNDNVTDALKIGLGAILDKAQSKPLINTEFQEYLTVKYHDCVKKDRYCLGYFDALQFPTGMGSDKPLADATFSRLLLFLAAVDDRKMLDELVAAMQARTQNDRIPLRFPEFRKQLLTSFTPSNKRLMREAFLDFFYHYKQALLYPNDFVPYDLQRTAHVLDSLFAPIVDAFNADVDSYVEEKLENALCAKEADQLSTCKARAQTNVDQEDPCVEQRTQFDACSKKGVKGFAGRGMVQVASLSGSTASVYGRVNNYFDITPSPSLNDILDKSQNKNIADALTKVLEPKQIAIAQALANLGSPPKITAEVSKDTTLNITPTALDSASSAELDLDFDVKDDKAPQSTSQVQGRPQKQTSWTGWRNTM